MNLKINYALIIILLLGCGKDHPQSSNKNQLNPQSITSDQQKKDLESIEKLLGSSNPNLALANYLIKSLDIHNTKLKKTLIDEINPKDIEIINSEIKEKEKEIKEYFLFNNQNYRNDTDLFSKSILNKKGVLNYSFSEQLEFATLNHLKNKTLNEIIATYNKRSEELSSRLSLFVAREIGRNDQGPAQKIEKLIESSNQKKAIQAIKRSKEFISKMDELFKSSNLNESEQYLVVSSELVAYGIYEIVKENKTFKKIIQEGNIVIQDINEFREKGKEFLVLTTSLKKHFDETKENLDIFSSSLSQASKDMRDAVDEGVLTIGPTNNIRREKVLHFIYNDILLGNKSDPQGINPSILSKKRDISENIKKSLNSFNNLNNNLTNILQTTQKMSQILGIGPSKEVGKIIAKAKVVSEVTQTVSNIVVGWASGGPLGVISALSVSPIPGFSQKSGEEEMLQEISRKLDVIISNQEQILKNQIETMKMIKDLANLMNDFHVTEMIAIAELREMAIINQETTNFLVHKDLNTCDQILTEKLSRNSIFLSDEYLKQAGSINLYFKYALNSFEKLFEGKNKLNIFLNSNLKDRFTSCVTGLAEVFSGTDIKDNPIKNIFNSTELYSFQKTIYFPLVSILKHNERNINFEEIPLHIPLASVKDIRIKGNYITRSNDNISSGDQTYYELDNLISTRGLERSVTSLVLLHPFLDIEKNTWGSSVSEIVNTYLTNTSNQSSISYLYLRNALRLTQSAIAQEAILAGEPLLETIRSKYGDKIFSQKKCQVESLKDAPKSTHPLLCSLRGNRLLLKNYLKYLLYEKLEKNHDLYKEYSKAVRAKDKLRVSYLLGTGVNESSISFIDSPHNIQATIKVYNQDLVDEIVLPSVKEIQQGSIIFSENMETLLNIQETILNELVKVTPAYDRINSSKLLSALLLKNM